MHGEENSLIVRTSSFSCIFLFAFPRPVPRSQAQPERVAHQFTQGFSHGGTGVDFKRASAMPPKQGQFLCLALNDKLILCSIRFSIC